MKIELLSIIETIQTIKPQETKKKTQINKNI
jgi:hypothetical protein